MVLCKFRSVVPAAFLLVGLTAAAAAQDYRFSFAFGQRGSANGQIGTVRQVAVNPAGAIFAADAQGRVSIFDSAGRYQTKINTTAPRAVAVSPVGNFVVAGADTALYDANLKRMRGLNVTLAVGLAAAAPSGAYAIIDSIQNLRSIDLFDGNGVRTGQIAPLINSANGKTSVYASLAYAPNGDLYALDSVNQQVNIFDSQGLFRSSFRNDGVFTKGITGIAINGAGAVAISDMFADKVYLFDLNAQYQGSLGAPGSGDGQFNNPAGLAFSPNGSLIVSDLGNARIEVFAAATPEPGAGAMLVGFAGAGGLFLLRRRRRRVIQFTVSGLSSGASLEFGSGFDSDS